jgi:hypothetical protein
MGCYPIKNPKDILQLSLETCIAPKILFFNPHKTKQSKPKAHGL